VVTIEEEDEDEEFRDGVVEASDSKDSWGETRDVQAEVELAKAGLVAPWVVMGTLQVSWTQRTMQS